MKKYTHLGLVLTLILTVTLAGCGSNNPTSQTWPSSWQHQDIGTGILAGSASYQNGTFTITGAGALIWPYKNDQLHFVYQPMNGDFTIIARVASMQKTDECASAGLMVRNSLEPNSQMVQFYVNPSLLGYFASRKTIDSPLSSGSENITAITLYLKLVRRGNEFSGFYSTDGKNWDASIYNDNAISTVEMNNPVYVGMFVLSYDANILETDTFNQVSITTP